MLSVNHRQRPAIGLLISFLDGAYQQEFWRGLDDFCRDAGCELIVFASRLRRSHTNDWTLQEAVYQLADPSRIDGLCVDASAFPDEESLRGFLSARPAIRGLPIVMTSMSVDDVPSVLPDNRQGLRQVLSHLEETHGCRNFAYIGGPLRIEDARVRLKAFEEFMAERHQTAGRSYIDHGEFDAPSGRAATERLLDSGFGADAIVYANDEMAFGGIDALKERGIRVPDDVLVTGFDNSDAAAFSSPSLSSVSQPIRAKAQTAGRYLLELIEGKRAASIPLMPLTLVTRGSCGCAETSPQNGHETVRALQKAVTGMKQVTEFLGAVPDLALLDEGLRSAARVLGLKAAYVMLFEPAEDGLPSPQALAIAAAGTTDWLSPAAPRRFHTGQLVPAYLVPSDERRTWIVQLLHHNGQQYGFSVVDARDVSSFVLVSLGDQLSAALSTIDTLQQLSESQVRLKEALDEAQTSRQRYRDLTEHLPTLLVETDADGRIRYLNRKAQQVLGVAEHETAVAPPLQAFADRDLSLGDAEHFVPFQLTSKEGMTTTVLAKTFGSRLDRRVQRWNAIDFRPIVDSMTLPETSALTEFGLTPRERQVLQLKLEGYLAKEIAARLNVSLSTVKGHVRSIYEKLNVHSEDALFSLVRQRLVSAFGHDSLVLSLISRMLRE